MEARATAKFIRMSPRKVRHVIDLIRGKNLAEALAILRFTPNLAAEPIRKVVESAAANAQTNHSMVRDALYVATAFVDEGPSMRRMRPGSIGRGGIIRRRMSHITVGLAEREELKTRRSEARTRRTARPARPAATRPPAEARPPAAARAEAAPARSSRAKPAGSPAKSKAQAEKKAKKTE